MRNVMILAAVFIALLWFVLSLASCTTSHYSNSMQVKVIDYKIIQRGKANVTGVNMKKDTVYLNYGWAGKRNTALRKGAWLTVRYNADSCKEGWVRAEIKVNQ